MADQPNLQLRRIEDRALWQDCVLALGAMRSVHTVVVWILLLTFLIPLATYGGFKWGMISDAGGESQAAAAGAPSWMGDARLTPAARQALHFAPFVARFMTLLLITVYFLATNVCLVGRLGTAHHCVGAFFWMVLLLVFLIPWHAWFGGAPLPGLFYELDALLVARSDFEAMWPDGLAYYTQFVVAPFLGFLAVLVSWLRFRKCYTSAVRRAGHSTPVTE